MKRRPSPLLSYVSEHLDHDGAERDRAAHCPSPMSGKNSAVMAGRTIQSTKPPIPRTTPTMTALSRAVSEKSFGMRHTMPNRGARLHPQRRGLGKLRIAADALGCSETVAHKRLYGDESVAEQTGALIAAFLRQGDHETYARLMQPIDAAHLSQEPRNHEEVEHECDQLDAIEDVAQSEWRQTRSDAALDEYVAKKGQAIYKEIEHLNALKAEQKRRREAKS